MRMGKKVNKIFAAAIALAAGAAILGGAWWGVKQHRAAVRTAERKSMLKRFGLMGDGTSDFVALPSSLTHRAPAARLGQRLFADRRLARSAYRVCGACHRLNEGGIDSRALGGKLARPAYNAVCADVFLHDGSVTGMPALVQRMIEDDSFCAGGPLSNIVARLATDEKTVRDFQFAYEDGVTTTNLVDALVEYEKTLFTSGEAFDLWCSGRKSALNVRQQQGLEIFKRQKCISCHDGPALGTLKVVDGRKVPALRGLGQRKAYLPDARRDLGAVLTLMPGGYLEEDDRIALVSFLKAL